MMKRRNRLILITVLVAALLLALLHGCQSSVTPANVPEKTEAPMTEPTAGTTAGAETTEAAATELPEISTEATDNTESTQATEAPTEAPTETTEAATEPETPSNPKPADPKPANPTPTPTEPKTTEPAPTEPTPTDPSPTEPPHTHSWSDWTQTKAPSCTAGGEEIRTCSCGATESRATDALGHDWVHHDEERHRISVLTCYCGQVFYSYEDWSAHFDSFLDDEDELDNHAGYSNYGEWVVDKPAYDSCSRCGATR